jgi:hypothetical protein
MGAFGKIVSIKQEEQWAVAHGDLSATQHRILTAQIDTSQAAACGYAPDDGVWSPVVDEDPEVTARWSALPRCRACTKTKVLA